MAVNPLLALVKEQGLIDDLLLEEVLQEQTRSGKGIGQMLNDFGIVEMETQLQIIASHLGSEVVDLSERELGPELVHLLPRTVAHTHQAAPLPPMAAPSEDVVADAVLYGRSTIVAVTLTFSWEDTTAPSAILAVTSLSVLV